MPADRFHRTADVTADVPTAWRTITDVPTLVGWMSIVRDATVVADLERYQAVLEDRVGLFSLRADLDIVVVEHTSPSLIVVRAEGEDRQVGSRIVVDATVDLADAQGGSTITVDGTYEVSGKVATLGAGTIRKKAGRILDEFFDRLEEELS